MQLTECPLRVDFAGGWLDVPELSIPGGYIVNCAISPLVSLERWPYERQSGLGGSAAWHLLSGRDSWECERSAGAGWQDPAVIREGGLCVWRSGPSPVLSRRDSGEFLRGRMALLWTGQPHDTASIKTKPRDYSLIRSASQVAGLAVATHSFSILCSAINASYRVQIDEGMSPLPEIGMAKKYCGSGHGGYALYLFPSIADRDASGLLPIEPFEYR